MRYLEHGRVADVSRLATTFGWSPRPTIEAFETFVAARAGTRLLPTGPVVAAEQVLLDALTRRRTVSVDAGFPAGPIEGVVGG